MRSHLLSQGVASRSSLPPFTPQLFRRDIEWLTAGLRVGLLPGTPLTAKRQQYGRLQPAVSADEKPAHGPRQRSAVLIEGKLEFLEDIVQRGAPEFHWATSRIER